MRNNFCYYENKTADKLHECIAANVTYKESKNIPRIKKWNKFTGEIPSIRKSPAGFKNYYLSKVIDQDSLNDLEDEKIINAMPNLAKLYPIITPSDGNCLCHAVSQYMWGIPDRRNFLRQLLYVTLVTDDNKLLERLYMQHIANEQSSEENFNTGIWSRQWDRLVMEAQETPVISGSTRMEPLEAIHIFVLANILLRPIIVLSSPVVRTLYNQTIQTNNIGGIYLPLLCNPNDTEKSPIVLGFHMNHFTPLIYMENSIQNKAIPLKHMEMVSLPLHFSQDILPNCIAKRLQTYLNIDVKTGSVVINPVPLPKDHNMFFAHFEHCKTLYDKDTQPIVGKATAKVNDQMNGDEWNDEFLERHSETIHIINSNLSKSPSPCINNCGMYGSAELGNRCSKCFAENVELSDRFPHRNVKQELRAVYKDEFVQNTHEQIAPAKECKTSEFLFPQKKTQDISMQDYKYKQPQALLFSHNDSHSREFSNSKDSQDESTQFIPILQVKDQQSEQFNLETATCVTPSCREKAHRHLEYRCVACFIERNTKSKGTSFLKNDPKNVDGCSQHPENFAAMLSGQAAVASSANLSPINRIQIATQEPSVSTEERQVSLLDLLCSEENCPNRRISPLHSMCSSCSEKNGKYFCSTPGCKNKRQQNRLAMCNDCFRSNELKIQKIPTQRNVINHIPEPLSNNTNHVRKTCDKPTCINSGGAHCSGYCIKCYMYIERSDHPQPSAPSFLR